jgi:hypothetical protein
MSFVAVSKDIVQLDITQAELIWLLRFLKIPELPGVPNRLAAQELPTEAEAGALINALQSLQVRGLVKQTGENQITIDEGVIGILGACARANQIVLIRRFTEHGPAVINAFLLPELGILHEQPLGFSHRFSAVTAMGVFRDLLREQLALPAELNGAVTFDEQQIDRETLDVARLLLIRDKQPAAAFETLLEAGWPKEAANGFLETVDTIRAATSVIVIDTSASPLQTTLAFELAVSDKAICYVLDGDPMRVGSTNAEDVFESILQVTPTLAI